MFTRSFRCAGLVLLLSVLLVPAASAAPITYLATIDTTAVAGSTGLLFFSLANTGGDSAFVTVSAFSSDGTLLAVDATISSGAYTGSLPGPITLDDALVDTRFAQGFAVETFLQFLVAFSGPAVESPSGTGFGNTFSFVLYDNSGTGATLGPVDAYGNTFTIDINSDGTTTPSLSSAVTLSAVPEPSTLMMLGLGMVAVGMRRYKPERNR